MSESIVECFNDYGSFLSSVAQWLDGITFPNFRYSDNLAPKALDSIQPYLPSSFRQL